MKLRKQKKNDQDLTKKTYELLKQFLEEKQRDYNIESALWIGPMMCCIIQAYENSGIPFNELKKEMQEALEFYRY